MKTVCRCYGTTGSCTMKTCWRKLPHQREVSTILKKKYDDALKVAVTERSIGPAFLRAVGTQTVAPLSARLVYIKNSLNPCIGDSNFTTGRQCVPRSIKQRASNSNSTVVKLEDGLVNTDFPVCEEVCCAQRYTSTRKVISTQCNCVFVWCCQVFCDICAEVVKTYQCSAD